jgi:hypothetical protein
VMSLAEWQKRERARAHGEQATVQHDISGAKTGRRPAVAADVGSFVSRYGDDA